MSTIAEVKQNQNTKACRAEGGQDFAARTVMFLFFRGNGDKNCSPHRGIKIRETDSRKIWFESSVPSSFRYSAVSSPSSFFFTCEMEFHFLLRSSPCLTFALRNTKSRMSFHHLDLRSRQAAFTNVHLQILRHVAFFEDYISFSLVFLERSAGEKISASNIIFLLQIIFVKSIVKILRSLLYKNLFK